MQQTYTVMPGDSVSGISKKFFGDFSMTNAIAALNNITNPDLIYSGQILKIPDVADAVVITEEQDAAKKKARPGSGSWYWALPPAWDIPITKRRKKKTSEK